METDAEATRFVIPSPQLVWDCNCYLSADQRAKWQVRPCRIHKELVLGPLIPEAYRVGMTLHFNSVSVAWRHGLSTRPSIDTLNILKYLHSVDFPLRGLRVLDLGCGSGILGIYAALHGARVDFVDKRVIELSVARDNVSRHTGIDRHVHSYLSLPRDNYDLVLSNPPYFATSPDGTREFPRHSHSGQRLTRRLLSLPNRLAKKVIFTYSHAGPVYDDIVERGFTTILFEFTVPLRVPHLFTVPMEPWIDEQLARGRIAHVTDAYHPLHHKISCFLLAR